MRRVCCRALASTLVLFAALGLALAGPGAAQSARLVIPRLGVDTPLAARLDAGPTVYFRDADTVAVAGHRTTWTRPFRHLDRLRRGDAIRLGGRLYRVRRVLTVRPWEKWILRYSGLVLSTCHPAGSAAFRLVVFAAPV